MNESLAPYIWPEEKDNQFVFETLADCPGTPGQPVARGIGKSLYEVTWEKAESNGAPVLFYSLEYKLVGSNLTYQSQRLVDIISYNDSTRSRREARPSSSNLIDEDHIVDGGEFKVFPLWYTWIPVFNGTGKSSEITSSARVLSNAFGFK